MFLEIQDNNVNLISILKEPRLVGNITNDTLTASKYSLSLSSQTGPDLKPLYVDLTLFNDLKPADLWTQELIILIDEFHYKIEPRNETESKLCQRQPISYLNNNSMYGFAIPNDPFIGPIQEYSFEFQGNNLTGACMPYNFKLHDYYTLT